MARPEAVSQAQIGQAKLGQNGGSMTALAWPGMAKSQSQAVRPWLSRAKGGNFFCRNLNDLYNHQTLIYQCAAVVPCRFLSSSPSPLFMAPHPHIHTSLSTFFF